jgi:hypothetical protein
MRCLLFSIRAVRPIGDSFDILNWGCSLIVGQDDRRCWRSEKRPCQTVDGSRQCTEDQIVKSAFKDREELGRTSPRRSTAQSEPKHRGGSTVVTSSLKHFLASFFHSMRNRFPTVEHLFRSPRIADRARQHPLALKRAFTKSNHWAALPCVRNQREKNLLRNVQPACRALILFVDGDRHSQIIMTLALAEKGL